MAMDIGTMVGLVQAVLAGLKKVLTMAVQAYKCHKSLKAFVAQLKELTEELRRLQALRDRATTAAVRSLRLLLLETDDVIKSFQSKNFLDRLFSAGEFLKKLEKMDEKICDAVRALLASMDQPNEVLLRFLRNYAAREEHRTYFFTQQRKGQEEESGPTDSRWKSAWEFSAQSPSRSKDEKLAREISNMKDFCMPETLKEMLSSLRGELNGRMYLTDGGGSRSIAYFILPGPGAHVKPINKPEQSNILKELIAKAGVIHEAAEATKETSGKIASDVRSITDQLVSLQADDPGLLFLHQDHWGDVMSSIEEALNLVDCLIKLHGPKIAFFDKLQNSVIHLLIHLAMEMSRVLTGAQH